MALVLDIRFITIHDSFTETYSNFGVFKAAKEKHHARIASLNLRDFSNDKHGTIDDKPYGGGDGMIMKPEPLAAAIQKCSSELKNPYIISTSPGGKSFQQSDTHRLRSLERPLVFVCGRFGGIDQRFIDHYVDEEFSLGDFVISGGELPTLMIADAILRTIPGVLGNDDSQHFDSFSQGTNHLLEAPSYTRPKVFEGASVPEVLMSGNHKDISSWQKSQSIMKTHINRPDLLS